MDFHVHVISKSVCTDMVALGVVSVRVERKWGTGDEAEAKDVNHAVGVQSKAMK